MEGREQGREGWREEERGERGGGEKVERMGWRRA